jgi:hypothetical protein
MEGNHTGSKLVQQSCALNTRKGTAAAAVIVITDIFIKI